MVQLFALESIASLLIRIFKLMDQAGYLVDFGLALLGFYLARLGRLPSSLAQLLTTALVTIIYPSLIFSALTGYFRVDLLMASWDLPVFLAVLMASGFLIGIWAVRFTSLKAWPEKLRHSFVFMAAMPNFVFLPLLITKGFWGQEATAYLILASFGGDLFLWLVAVPALGARGLWWRVFIKPPVLALLMAISIILWDIPEIFGKLEIINPWLAKLGRLTVPISMLLLGYYLGSQKFERQGLRSQLVLTGFRLIITPLCCALVLAFWQPDPTKAQVLFLVSTMPTAFASAILARLFGGDPHYCAQQILISHFFAILTVPIWLYCSPFFF